jgi:hypothetical protein
LKKSKVVTHQIYGLLNTAKQQNFILIKEKCKVLFQSVFDPITAFGFDKSLFMDFMNYETEINYCLEMITLHDMNTHEINLFLFEEMDYINSLLLCIRNIKYPNLT